MRTRRRDGADLALEAAVFGAAVAQIALWHSRPPLLAASLLATGAVALAIWRGRRSGWVYGVGGVVGPVAEILCSKAGAWAYAYPSFLGIPAWLPFAWALAALLVARVAETAEALARRG